MISHGVGRRYIQGGEIASIIKADKLAEAQCKYLKSNKRPKAPKIKVTVLRKVSEHE